MFGWDGWVGADEKPTEENQVYSQDKTGGQLAPFTPPPYKTVSSSSSSLPLISFLFFSKFDRTHFLFHPNHFLPRPILSLRLLQPPPFTPGQFFNLFEESVDTRIKPLWPTRSSATYRQSTRLLFGCATVQCNTI